MTGSEARSSFTEKACPLYIPHDLSRLHVHRNDQSLHERCGNGFSRRIKDINRLAAQMTKGSFWYLLVDCTSLSVEGRMQAHGRYGIFFPPVSCPEVWSGYHSIQTGGLSEVIPPLTRTTSKRVEPLAQLA